MENNLISENQSGFKPGDSCTYQLLSIAHEIYNSFDESYEEVYFVTYLKLLIKFGMKA